MSSLVNTLPTMLVESTGQGELDTTRRQRTQRTQHTQQMQHIHDMTTILPAPSTATKRQSQRVAPTQQRANRRSMKRVEPAEQVGYNDSRDSKDSSNSDEQVDEAVEMGTLLDVDALPETSFVEEQHEDDVEGLDSDIALTHFATLSTSSEVDDAMRMYLRELGRVPLLTMEQEVLLAQRIQRAEREQKRAQARGLTADAAILRAGQEARHRFVEANLRLVVSIARKYIGRGLSLLDLIQEGNAGLLQAVEKFDYTKGFRFSTYASWHIRHAIVRALENHGRTIRLPVHLIEDINQMNTISRRLAVELGRDPSTEEIAREMHIRPDKLEEFRQLVQEPLSLETPVGEEHESSLGDFVEDDAPNSTEQVAQQALREQIALLLRDLDERERAIIQLRFGFVDGESHTLEEVGKRLHLTRERVRQLEVKALKKLRIAGSSKQLQDFLG